MEILIQGDNAFNMRVLDAATGDSIKRVKKIELEITATGSMAKIHIVNPKVDVRINADVVEVDPPSFVQIETSKSGQKE